MVLRHLTVHDVSRSYGLWHLCTILEGDRPTVGYLPSTCGAWETLRHLTSSSMRAMTHWDGLLPRNARLQNPYTANGEKHSWNMYSAHVYSRWLEDNSYISLLVVKTGRVWQCWRRAGWFVYCPLKVVTVGMSNMVWGYRGIWEIPAGFVQENRLPAWTGPCVHPVHSRLLFLGQLSCNDLWKAEFVGKWTRTAQLGVKSLALYNTGSTVPASETDGVNSGPASALQILSGTAIPTSSAAALMHHSVWLLHGMAKHSAPRMSLSPVPTGSWTLLQGSKSWVSVVYDINAALLLHSDLLETKNGLGHHSW